MVARVGGSREASFAPRFSRPPLFALRDSTLGVQPISPPTRPRGPPSAIAPPMPCASALANAAAVPVKRLAPIVPRGHRGRTPPSAGRASRALTSVPRAPKLMCFALTAGVAEWQTRWTQNPVWATKCGFKSHLRHFSPNRCGMLRNSAGNAVFFGISCDFLVGPRIVVAIFIGASWCDP